MKKREIDDIVSALMQDEPTMETSAGIKSKGGVLDLIRVESPSDVAKTLLNGEDVLQTSYGIKSSLGISTMAEKIRELMG